MDSTCKIVFGIMKASSFDGKWVDMGLFWQNLREAGIGAECLNDIVASLESQGFLMVSDSGELLLAKTGWQCPDCLGTVSGLWSQHMNACMKVQRRLRELTDRLLSRLRVTWDDVR